MIRELYDNVMYFPNKILNIFNDFFGEERVDMQGFWSYEEFSDLISENKLSFFFHNKDDVFDSSEFKNANKEDKAVIENMLDDGALDNIVLNDSTLATYFLPMLPTAMSRISPQGFILVHFPHVRVTNEHDRFVDINHLWVKIEIKISGKGTGFFTLNRSEYPLSHIKAGYLHSHVPSISFADFSWFMTPCLGTGPIRNTVSTLAIEYDEAIWKLFCLELDKYVRVESISGMPYKYLENIGKNDMIYGESDFNMLCGKYVEGNTCPLSKEDIRDFVKYLIGSKKLKFNFINGSYGFAMSYLDYRILISNEFIKWYNQRYNLGVSNLHYEDLINSGVLRKCIISNGKIQYFLNEYNNDNSTYYIYEGRKVCTFKGKPINVHIVDDSATDTTNEIVLIGTYITEIIAKAVLTIVNYKYGREEEEVGINTSTIYL